LKFATLPCENFKDSQSSGFKIDFIRDSEIKKIKSWIKENIGCIFEKTGESGVTKSHTAKSPDFQHFHLANM
jgi:hypothetical protein